MAPAVPTSRLPLWPHALCSLSQETSGHQTAPDRSPWMFSRTTCLLHVLLHDMHCFHAKQSTELCLKTFTANPIRKANSAFSRMLGLVLLTKPLLTPQPPPHQRSSHGTTRTHFTFPTFPQPFPSQQLLTAYHDIMKTTPVRS